ncbi:MAG: hypothetical protein IJZ85_06670 [Lachnospiraceae bacterium]|nr:hypothetical protein [Lachnospiraceae bacterium]
MVNQEKVRLMAQAEWYRQREKRGALLVNRYSKGAYVSMQIVKSMIIATLGVLVVLLVWALHTGEQLLAVSDFSVLIDLGMRIAVIYGAILVMAVVIAWRTYSRRYTRSRSSVKKYYNLLRRINYWNEKDKRRLTGQIPQVRREGEAE